RGLLVGDDVAEKLGGFAGVGFVVGVELFTGQLDQFRQKSAVLGQPFFALDFRALAVAGVGEEVGPLGLERFAALVIGFGGEDGADFPVFGRNKRFNLALALDDQAHRDALHASRAQPSGDLAP